MYTSVKIKTSPTSYKMKALSGVLSNKENEGGGQYINACVKSRIVCNSFLLDCSLCK